VNVWLEEAVQRLGQATDGEYALSDADAETLLELARVAAHESGDRRNAPLVCYLVGLAHRDAPALALAELAGTAGGAG
jgi:hypothetical protein